MLQKYPELTYTTRKNKEKIAIFFFSFILYFCTLKKFTETVDCPTIDFPRFAPVSIKWHQNGTKTYRAFTVKPHAPYGRTSGIRRQHCQTHHEGTLWRLLRANTAVRPRTKRRRAGQKSIARYASGNGIAIGRNPTPRRLRPNHALIKYVRRTTVKDVTQHIIARRGVNFYGRRLPGD